MEVKRKNNLNKVFTFFEKWQFPIVFCKRTKKPNYVYTNSLEKIKHFFWNMILNLRLLNRFVEALTQSSFSQFWVNWLMLERKLEKRKNKHFKGFYFLFWTWGLLMLKLTSHNAACFFSVILLTWLSQELSRSNNISSVFYLRTSWPSL